MSNKIHLVECPRDAMQGWKHFIPTARKAEYINALLNVGFDTIDFGSFVSPKAIPQMADTKEVLGQLLMDKSRSKLLAIVANVRGAEEALEFDEISNLGFPFSVSPTFQQRNTNSTIEESLKRVEEIQNLCLKYKKELVVYISMGFGNPYGDIYNEEIVMQWIDKIVDLNIRTISIADTVGLAVPAQVSGILNILIQKYADVDLGVHLHSSPINWKAKVDAALQAGCKRFDGALKGIGGCPMANDDLVGNLDSELLIPHFKEKGLEVRIDKEALGEAVRIANDIFK